MSQERKNNELKNPQRLEKLFTSNRDLTLCSGKSSQRSQQPVNNKKSFAPNLNVSRSTRNKDA